MLLRKAVLATVLGSVLLSQGCARLVVKPASEGAGPDTTEIANQVVDIRNRMDRVSGTASMLQSLHFWAVTEINDALEAGEIDEPTARERLGVELRDYSARLNQVRQHYEAVESELGQLAPSIVALRGQYRSKDSRAWSRTKRANAYVTVEEARKLAETLLGYMTLKELENSAVEEEIATGPRLEREFPREERYGSFSSGPPSEPPSETPGSFDASPGLPLDPEFMPVLPHHGNLEL